MSTTALEQAIRSTSKVLAGVQSDQLDASTPCASWKVSEVINHVVGGQYFFAAMASGDSLGSEPPPDFASSDYAATFDRVAAATVTAFQSDGAMDKTMHLPFGDLPGSAVVNLAATDTFVHGWDLACATGQDTNLDPELAAVLLAGARMSIPDSFRGADGQAPFGAEQVAPSGATNADKLAAFLGRVVH
ncbi:MAG: TIGR03086 family metal-binding protein [Ilumatobacteraceae bacterium]